MTFAVKPQIQTHFYYYYTNTNNSRERVERERDEGDDGEKSSRAPVASDHRLGEQSARRRRRHD